MNDTNDMLLTCSSVWKSCCICSWKQCYQFESQGNHKQPFLALVNVMYSGNPWQPGPWSDVLFPSTVLPPLEPQVAITSPGCLQAKCQQPRWCGHFDVKVCQGTLSPPAAIWAFKSRISSSNQTGQREGMHGRETTNSGIEPNQGDTPQTSTSWSHDMSWQDSSCRFSISASFLFLFCTATVLMLFT